VAASVCNGQRVNGHVHAQQPTVVPVMQSVPMIDPTKTPRDVVSGHTGRERRADPSVTPRAWK
jgi:hypothetical protein